MKLKRTGLVRVGAWILTGLLAADIGLDQAGKGRGFLCGS